MEADDLSVLARSKINQPPSPEARTSNRGREVARQLVWSLCSKSPHDKKIGRTPTSVLCSRNARPEKGRGEPPDYPSCSQSPHDKTVVARCAQ
jgi:hypothetical protein